jgi:hypothetical protein
MTHANLSRRTIMSGVAALPALTVPALAAVDNSDAELLRLGAKLAVVDQERTTQLAIDRAERAAVDVEVERRTGITRFDARASARANGDVSGGYWAICEQVRRELGFRIGDGEDENDATLWDRINSRVYPILDAILEQRATTPEGLKIQARAVAMAASDLWDGQPENTHEMSFIESACSFFGMDAQSIAMGTPAAEALAAREAVQS